MDIDMEENGKLILVLIISGVITIICLFIFIKASTWFRTKKLKQRFSQSRCAEKEAEKILIKNGYTIIDRQKSKPLFITVGDKIHRYSVRIDYLVKKKGKVYVVEVKSGEKIPYITNRETRRQMLEYYLAYQPRGILLLNMKNKSISEVKFQWERASYRLWLIRIGYFLAGIFFALLLFYFLRGG